MKIAIGVRCFRSVGGAENFVQHLAAYLAQRGHEVTVYALSGKPMKGVTLRILKRPRFSIRYHRDWSTGRLISEALAEADADVTFGEQKVWNANVVRPGGGVEVTYWNYHLQRKVKWPWLASKIKHFCPKRRYDLMAEKKALTGSTLRTVIVNSELVRKDMIDCYPEVANKVRVVHNGANESPLSTEEAQRLRADMHRRLGLRGIARLALFIGHDFYRKGLESAILSLAEVMRVRPDLEWHLIVTGRGHIEPYQSMANRAGVGGRIHYLGDMKDAFQAYAAADAMLLPTYYDPFANVTAEALFYGLPVITTEENGGSEIIFNGCNGWVVESPKAIKQMAHCLIELSVDKKLEQVKYNALESSKLCRMRDTLGKVEDILIEASKMQPENLYGPRLPKAPMPKEHDEPEEHLRVI